MGLCPRVWMTGHNPVGVESKLFVPTQGSPRGAGNPGLEDAAPLGLIFPEWFAGNCDAPYALSS